VAVDSAGNVYVVEFENDDIRKIDSAQNVTTLAGLAGTPGNANGNGTAAQFQNPVGIAVDSAGNIYVADQGNSSIRIIDTAGNVNTLAGGNAPSAYGWVDANGVMARFHSPNAMTLDSAGNIYVTDQYNYVIRKIDTALNVTTLAGSPGNAGTVDGVEYAARFNLPAGIVVDSRGDLYVADEYNHRITKGAIAPPILVLNWPGGGPLQSDVPGGLTGPVQVSPTLPQSYYRLRR
jgi:sugar lactone lactonase YvrE